MNRIQKFFQILSRRFKRDKPEVRNPSDIFIPTEFSESEKIARIIFSPININPKNNSLRPNSFKPPSGSEDISVNRLDYTDCNFLKRLGRGMENPISNRNYFGLAITSVLDINQSNLSILYTPIEVENPFHSDIKIGFLVEPGKQLPAEVNERISNLLLATKLYEDFDPSNVEWRGENIE